MLDRLAPDRQPSDRAWPRACAQVAALPDPVGAVLRKLMRPNGLIIEKTAVPMGVVAIIYESRPNVTSDAAALAIKSGQRLHAARRPARPAASCRRHRGGPAARACAGRPAGAMLVQPGCQDTTRAERQRR